MDGKFHHRSGDSNEKRYKDGVISRRVAFILLLGAFIVAAIALRRSGAEVFDPAALAARLAAVRESGWLVPAYFLAFGLTTLLAPAFAFFVVAGVLWGAWPGVLIGWLGANGWSNLHFFAGRWLGGDRVQRFLEARKLDSIREELEGGGALATMIVRQLPLPFVGVNLAAGASPMKWSRWALGNALGLIPGSTVYGWSAASIVQGAEGARTEAIVRTLFAAAAVIGLGVVSRVVQRRVSGKGRAR
jgi:uncharacterized membrane protein YdjX (TVP38/TMEM64 family)